MTKQKIPLAVQPVDAQTPVRQRISYSKEFKLMAVKRLREGALGGTELAFDIGVRRNQLYKWAKAFDAKGEAGFPGPGRLPAEQESEIVRLRRELALAKEEVAILKKFDAYLTRPKK